MKYYDYVGLFRNDDGDEYELTVHTLGFTNAFILLTAKAIESGKHYQLANITDERGEWVAVGDIWQIGNILFSSPVS